MMKDEQNLRKIQEKGTQGKKRMKKIQYLLVYS